MLIPKVSVVVPIYKVEPYIERCVRSLFEQTLAEVEYIFVNDCTPDRSIDVLKQVLEAYPERKPWVKIIDMPNNVGAAKVREVGIKATTGAYIIHCDSDDWVDKDMYYILYEVAMSEDYDIVSCDYYTVDETTCVHVPCEVKGVGSFFSEIMHNRLHTSLCTRLIKQKIAINSCLRYPQAHMLEDRVYMIQYALLCKHIKHISEAYYYYNYNLNSICFNPSAEASLKRTMQAVENVNLIVDILSDKDLSEAYYKPIIRLKGLVRSYLLPAVREEPRKYIRIWRSIFPDINFSYLFLSSEPLIFRIVFVLTLLGVYPYIYKCLKWLKS